MSDKMSTESSSGENAAGSNVSNEGESTEALKVDTTDARKGRKGGGSVTPTAAVGQDQHPYARGAVIEVWHKPGASNSGTEPASSSTGWWSEPDSSDEEAEEETEKDEFNRENASKNKEENKDDNNNQEEAKTNGATIRLCDIIDRAQNPNTGAWRYYIHYRDFNRRMDEWVTTDRIVSPPSVGNAKARALKREQEALLKRQRRAEEESNAQLILETPRQRRRTTTPGPDGNDPNNNFNETEEGGRRTRLSRRKSTVQDDDATVTLSNADEGDDTEPTEAAAAESAASTAPSAHSQHGGNHHSHSNKHKEVVVVGDSVTTHTVGEHVVATLQAQELDEHEGLDEASLREHEEVTKVKNVAFMELGYYQMETWYFSPLPKELVGPTGFLEVLYVCEFTLSLFARKSELQRFQARIATKNRHPPGNEIYRSGNLAMFEVDGQEEKIYSQNLCYIAKLFLDHKTLYFDVDPFLFYVLCEVDARGYHPVGYFSKEKYSDVGYNLACILTFPAHQRKGYGRFLIAFSYELSKKEEKVGSPEKPMSDLGQQAYKPYWASTIIDFLLHQSAEESTLSVMDISKRTSIMAEDIVFTLNQLGLLKMINGVYFIAAEENLLRRLAQKYPIKKPFIDPSALHWTPFLTDVKRDKFSIHSKKASMEMDESLPRATPVPSTTSQAS